MIKRIKIAGLTSVLLVFGLFATLSHAALMGLYEFDGGGDGTSWDDATNWEQKLDPLGAVISGNPTTPPDGATSADIPLAGVVVDNSMPGQTALDVNIGTAAGAGSLGISGGGLLAGRDVFVGRDGGGVNAGSLDISGGTLDAGDDIIVGGGSVGTMTQSDGAVTIGDDLSVNAGSSLAMTGGTINVGDRFTTDDDAIVTVNGGEIIVNDDFLLFGSSQVTVDNGFMAVRDKLRFDDALTTGKLTINGGLVRSQEFGFFDDVLGYIMNGTLEINGSGVFQSQQPDDGSPISQLSIAQAHALISAGNITTSEAGPLGLIVQTVIVADFFGMSNVLFTQISIGEISIGEIPEPSSVALLSLGGLVLLMRRRKKA